MTSQNNQANNDSNIFWRRVPWWVPLLAAIITVTGTALFQTQCQSSNKPQDFTYRILVIDSENNTPIQNAQVTIDTKNTPSIFSATTTDIGIASFNLDATLANQAAEVSVIATGYVNRTISVGLVPNNQSQDILLTPKQIPTPIDESHPSEKPTHTPTPSTPTITEGVFTYQVIVQTRDSNHTPISDANVTLQIIVTDGSPPAIQNETTDTNGTAHFSFPNRFVNNSGKLTVHAEGYKTDVFNIDLFTATPSKTVQLELINDTPLENTSTATSIPSATETVSATPTPTPTRAVVIIPTSTPAPPRPISPVGTTHKNPVQFTWDGEDTLSYQITLINPSTDYSYVSEWVSGNTWVFISPGIPGDQFGEIQWFVTSDAGGQSPMVSFFFDPFPGGGNGDPDPTFTPPP